MFNSKRAVTLLAIAALTMMIAVSCGDDENSLCVGDENVIVALSLESIWIYRVSDYTNDSLHTPIRTITDTVMIVGDTTIEGDEWFITSIEDELWANRSDGFWVWKDFDDDVSEPYLAIKFPAALSQKYPVPVEDIHPDTMTIADMMAVTSVPYGTLTAISYRQDTYQDTLLSVVFYVRGIGKIKEITIPDRNTRQIFRTIELLRFSTTGC